MATRHLPGHGCKFIDLGYRPNQFDLQGLRTLIDLLMLRRVLNRPWRMVDIGAFTGLATLAMYRKGILIQNKNNGVIYSVDTWEGSEKDGSKKIYDRYDPGFVLRTFCSNMGSKLMREVFPLQGCAIKWGELFPTLHRDRFRLDLVFIDADYSYEWYKKVLQLWGSRIHRGGIICGVGYGFEQGVTKAVDEFGKDTVLAKSLWFKKF